MAAEAKNADNIFGVKQTLTIKNILHNNDRYKDSSDQTKTWYKHTVIFFSLDNEGNQSEYKGTFFQKESPQLLFENKVVQPGETLCFKPEKPIDEIYGHKLKFCYEKSADGSDQLTQPTTVVQGRARTFATGYSKDIVLHSYKDTKNPDLDEMVAKIIKVSLEIEKHLLG